MPQLDFGDLGYLALIYSMLSYLSSGFFFILFTWANYRLKFRAIYVISNFYFFLFFTKVYICFFDSQFVQKNIRSLTPNKFSNHPQIPIFFFFLITPLEYFEATPLMGIWLATIVAFIGFYLLCLKCTKKKKLSFFFLNKIFLISSNALLVTTRYSFLPISCLISVPLWTFFFRKNVRLASLLNYEISEYFCFFLFYFLALLNTNIHLSTWQSYCFFFFYYYWFLTATTFSIVLCFGSMSLAEEIFFCFFFSVISNFGVFIIGIKNLRFKFFTGFLPSGAPIQIFFLLILVETISYLIKFFSLAIRIFANMVSGGILTKILTGFMLYLGGLLHTAIFASVTLWIIIILVLFLEFFIAGLQAYIFIFLSIVYLDEVLQFGNH